MYNRGFVVGSNKATFEGGKLQHGGEEQFRNDVLIPIAIYGIKGVSA